jgi:TonB-linked SusC/RagA family outer membrane protein
LARFVAILLCLTAAGQAALAQAGVVVDEAGRPLSGVQVLVQETNLGAVTDDQGRFQFRNLTGTEVTLQLRMLGYRSLNQTVAVGSTGLRFIMTEAAIQLDQIVVTGTAGGAQKRELGNTVSTISALEMMEIAPIATASDLLTGRTPGVLVRPGSGTAGAGSRIKIRGTSSLTLDTQPLIYVDGVRLDNAVGSGPQIQGGGITSRFNDINPDDIESIEVIKGPAAATLYGTEAASGVIQIITKKGRPGQLDVGVTIRQGVTWFMDPEGRFPTNWYRGPETNDELRSLSIVREENERGVPIFRNGHLQGYGINVTGGEERFRYYVGGDFDRDEGVEKPNVSTRLSGRGNLTVLPHPSIDVVTSLGVTAVRTDLAREESPTSSVTGATKRANPRQLALNPESRGFYARPPEAIWEAFKLSQEVDRFTTSLQLNHRPAGWLTHRLTVGADLVHENNVVLTPFMSPEVAQFFSANAARGSKDVNRRDVTNTTVDYSASVTYEVSNALTSTTSGGAQYYRKLSKYFSASGDQFPAPGVTTVGSAAIRLGDDDQVENVTLGAYAQQQFSLNDRLFVTGAVRLDDNSAFGRDFDVQTYPKVSASWVLSEEPFFNVGIIDVLRLRGAYGASGQQPDAFAAIRTFAPVTGTSDLPTATPQSLGNSELGPERGAELEAGFETALFSDRISLDFTYYHQKTEDAILLAPVAPSTGFPGSRYVNAGEIRNRGVEVLLSVRPIATPSTSWDLAFNVSTNDSKILSLGGLPTIGTTGTSPGGPSAEHREGFPPWSFFVKKVVSADFDASGATINVLCDGGTGIGGAEQGGAPVPCDEAPRVYHGKLEPDVQGSVTSTVTLFERLRLSVLFDFQGGRTQFAEDNWVRCSIYRVCLENYEPTQFEPERIAEVERAGSSFERSIWYTDADFVKLRELSLNYTLPDNWAERIKAKRASITIAGRNLHTWTSWQQLDPESSKLGLVGGFDQATVPLMASLVTTVRLTY